MYLTNNPIFAYHKRKFGDQLMFGYKDVIPLITAPNFDPEKCRSVRPRWREVRRSGGRTSRQFRDVGFRRDAVEFGKDGAEVRHHGRAGQSLPGARIEFRDHLSPRVRMAVF